MRAHSCGIAPAERVGAAARGVRRGAIQTVGSSISSANLRGGRTIFPGEGRGGPEQASAKRGS